MPSLHEFECFDSISQTAPRSQDLFDDLSIIFNTNEDGNSSLILRQSPSDTSDILETIDVYVHGQSPDKILPPNDKVDQRLPHSDTTLSYGQDISMNLNNSMTSKRRYENTAPASPYRNGNEGIGNFYLNASTISDHALFPQKETKIPLKEIQPRATPVYGKRLVLGHAFSENEKENLPTLVELPEEETEHLGVNPKEFGDLYHSKRVSEALAPFPTDTSAISFQPFPSSSNAACGEQGYLEKSNGSYCSGKVKFSTKSATKNVHIPGSQVFIFNPVNNTVGLMDVATVANAFQPTALAYNHMSTAAKYCRSENIPSTYFQQHTDSPSVCTEQSKDLPYAVIETASSAAVEKTIAVRKNVRYKGNNLYTPRYVRGHGPDREGLCELCKMPTWFNMKFSTYWYHMNFFHGVNPKSGTFYPRPEAYRVVVVDDIALRTLQREPLAKKSKGPIPLQLLGRKDPPNAVYQGLCSFCHDWVDIHFFQQPGNAAMSQLVTRPDGSDLSSGQVVLRQGVSEDDSAALNHYAWFKHVQRCSKYSSE
jgi:hypothetical protein